VVTLPLQAEPTQLRSGASVAANTQKPLTRL
jgi:hypothetical protein